MKTNFQDEKYIKRMLDLQNIETIPGLHQKNSHESFVSRVCSGDYYAGSENNILYPIIENNDVIVVAGAFFGDEGKGKTVDAVAEHHDVKLIARVNSGENAGHTVYYNGKKYIFHLAPSGIFSGKINAIGPNCVMDIVSFMDNEIKPLAEDKISYSNLFVGNVNLVFPHHKIIDALGQANSSTLKGMSPIHSSKVRKKGLRLDDLCASYNHQAKLLETDMKIYNALMKYHQTDEGLLIERFTEQNKVNKVIPDHVMNFLKAKDKVTYTLDLYNDYFHSKTFPKRENVNWLIEKTLEHGNKVLLEGPQSYFLSNMVSTHWRSSTSADTTAAGVMAAAEYNLTKYKTAVINVHKTPASSRIGLGANPAGYVSQDIFSKNGICTLEQLAGICEDYEKIEEQFFASVGKNGILNPTTYYDKEGNTYPISVAMAIASAKQFNEHGATTLKPRITGMFDCVAHSKVNKVQGPYLTISALDRGDFSNKVGLVIAYAVSNMGNEKLISNGRQYNHGDLIMPGNPIPNENVLHSCVPVIKVMDGWKDTPLGKRSFAKGEKLPNNVNKFLSEIESRTGAEIISIGNSPERYGLIYLN